MNVVCISFVFDLSIIPNKAIGFTLTELDKSSIPFVLSIHFLYSLVDKRGLSRTFMKLRLY